MTPSPEFDSGNLQGRRLPFRRRMDLSLSRQWNDDGVVWVIKEPIGLRYFRISEQEMFVLNSLNGDVDLAELKVRFERRFAPKRTSAANLQAYLYSLYEKSLVLTETTGQGEQRYARGRRKRRFARISSASNLLAIRLPGINPRRLLDGIYPLLRPLFHSYAVTAYCVVVLSALLLVVVKWSTFVAKLPDFHEFFAFSNLVWLAATIALAKVAHELGHALTCRHFGGECREMGLMFLVGTPALYCDVSDSWMLPDKRHRIAIAAAGVAVEIALAALCTFVWWFSAPGLWHYLSLNVMFACTVGTLLLNANPLMRLDGYYILSDVWATPNLWQKSRSALLRLAARACFGFTFSSSEKRLPRERLRIYFYAAASILYRCSLLFAILGFVVAFFRRQGLEIIGLALASVSLLGVTVIPCIRLVRFLSIPGQTSQFKRRRTTVTLIVTAAILSAILFLPLPHRIVASMAIEPRNAERIYVSIPGCLVNAKVKPGQSVAAGETLATLRNSDLEWELAKLEGEVARHSVRVRSLERQRADDSQSGLELFHARAALADSEVRLTKRREDQGRLTIKATVAGMVLPPPSRNSSTNLGSSSPTWRGTPIDPENSGAFLDAGTLFCLIGNMNSADAVIVIEQSAIGFVRLDQFTELNLDELPGEVFVGRVTELSEARVDAAPRQLSSRLGGDVDTRPNLQGEEQTTEVLYLAKVPIEGLRFPVPLGFRGTAKIHTESLTVAERISRSLHWNLRFKP